MRRLPQPTFTATTNERIVLTTARSRKKICIAKTDFIMWCLTAPDRAPVGASDPHVRRRAGLQCAFD